MPNFDGGHYFLTVFAPIRTDTITVSQVATSGEDRVVRADGSEIQIENRRDRSSVELLRKQLALLPTARQCAATADVALNSPFARNKRTHFLRFTVVDDVVFNGRDPKDAILTAIRGPNPIIAQPVDHLPVPYLMMTIDFDAKDGADATRDGYLQELWADAEPALRAVFEYCYDFDRRVTDGTSFARYIKDCQIETLMSFNDYHVQNPTQLVGMLPSFPTCKWSIGSIIVIAAALFATWWVTDFIEYDWLRVLVMIAAGLGYVAVAAYFTVHALTKAGMKPFPTAPSSDLKSVLKAVYLQQHFADFALTNQGADAATLQANFKAFVQEHRPDDIAGPTQEPGVLGVRKGAGQ